MSHVRRQRESRGDSRMQNQPRAERAVFLGICGPYHLPYGRVDYGSSLGSWKGEAKRAISRPSGPYKNTEYGCALCAVPTSRLASRSCLPWFVFLSALIFPCPPCSLRSHISHSPCSPAPGGPASGLCAGSVGLGCAGRRAAAAPVARFCCSLFSCLAPLLQAAITW